MELLLRRTLSRGIRPRYVSALLHACGGQGAATGVLTQRERDVLRLLGEGLSNRDISERLVLSEGTVKTHVHNLISKLGVESRAQALIRAREIGVLDD
jgi:ATP/maltotriose-dependent transcriptional regulator MalT